MYLDLILASRKIYTVKIKYNNKQSERSFALNGALTDDNKSTDGHSLFEYRANIHLQGSFYPIFKAVGTERYAGLSPLVRFPDFPICLSISALVKRGTFSRDDPQPSDGIFSFHCVQAFKSPTDFPN